MRIESESCPELQVSHTRQIVDVLPVELKPVVGYLSAEVFQSMLPFPGNDKWHTVGERSVLQLDERRKRLVDRRTTGSLEATLVDSRTAVFGETGLNSESVLYYVIIESNVQPLVMEILQIHSIPVDGIVGFVPFHIFQNT